MTSTQILLLLSGVCTVSEDRLSGRYTLDRCFLYVSLEGPGQYSKLLVGIMNTAEELGVLLAEKMEGPTPESDVSRVGVRDNESGFSPNCL